MRAEELRAVQRPLRERYREDPAAAEWTLHASGHLEDGPVCSVRTWAGVSVAGLHSAAGGDGLLACSGDMLLQALVACAGVTLKSVATAMDLPVRGQVRAEGELDFRGTLGVSREAPVGFREIRLIFELETDADDAQMDRLVRTTERYCVVYQTLAASPQLRTRVDSARREPMP